MTNSICKYKGAKINFDISGEGLENKPEYLEIIQAIKECDHLTDNIVAQFATIDASIRKFKETMYDTSDAMTSFSGNILDNVGKYKPRNEKDSEIAGVVALGAAAIGVLGLAVKGVGWGVSKVRQKNAEKKREQMIEEMNARKQEIIQNKYAPVKNFRDKFNSTILPRMNDIYHKEFSTSVMADDAILGKRVYMFKRALGLLVKTRFLVNTLDYSLAEMDAWKQGRDDSSFKPVSFKTLLEQELVKWPGMLGEKKTEWDEFVKGWLVKDTKEYPVSVALLFSDPAICSNYVGLNLRVVNNCDSALLEVKNRVDEELKQYPSSALLSKNPYIIDCDKNLKENWELPAPPSGFGLADLLLILFTYFIAFSICFFAFAYVPGWFVRALAVLLSIAIVALASIQFFDDTIILSFPADIRLPYVRRQDAYDSLVYEKREEIKKREKASRNKLSLVVKQS